MTREEAIEMVKSAFSAWESEFRVPNDDWSEEHKALDMAIEALSADSNCNNCKEYGSYKCTRCDGEIYYKADGDNYLPIR